MSYFYFNMDVYASIFVKLIDYKYYNSEAKERDFYLFENVYEEIIEEFRSIKIKNAHKYYNNLIDYNVLNEDIKEKTF